MSYFYVDTLSYVCSKCLLNICFRGEHECSRYKGELEDVTAAIDTCAYNKVGITIISHPTNNIYFNCGMNDIFSSKPTIGRVYMGYLNTPAGTCWENWQNSVRPNLDDHQEDHWGQAQDVFMSSILIVQANLQLNDLDNCNKKSAAENHDLMRQLEEIDQNVSMLTKLR